MNKIIFSIATTACLLIIACSSGPDKKGDKAYAAQGTKGMEYNVIKGAGGPAVEPGNFLKMHVTQKYNDSVLYDTRQAAPQISKYDSLSMTPESFKVFKGLAVGDSLEFSVPADSAFKGMDKWPAFAKKGGRLITTVKVLHIYRSEAEVKAETGETAY